ncbi:MAG: hypothetical protein RL333_69 [Pseudomonadota bacterium]|jgi:RNA recognition motif-containing protein
MKNLYIGNLIYGIDSQKLKALFTSFGPVKSASVVIDRDTGRSKGCGFVEMGATEASAAILALNGKEFESRALRVNKAKPRETTKTRGISPLGRDRFEAGPSRGF